MDRDTTTDTVIRAARREDARDIAELFLISSDGLATYIWSRLAEPGQSLEEVGAARYARDGVAFSYQNCEVMESDGDVIAMAHAFVMDPRAPDDVEDDPILKPYAELEDPGSLYLSGLAVRPEFQGRGLGGQLLHRVHDQAATLDCPRVSLICFERNEGAFRLYRREGYVELARRPLVPHPSLHFNDGDILMLAKTI